MLLSHNALIIIVSKQQQKKLTKINIKLSGSNFSQHFPILLTLKLVTNLPCFFEPEKKIEIHSQN